MFTDCPSCTRTYQINRAALGYSGRMVVCPSCDARWHVAVPEADGTPLRVASAPVAGRAQERRFTRPAASRARNGSFHPIAITLTCLFLASGLIAKRATIVKVAPRFAAFYAAIGLPVNVRGLVFGEVTTTWLEGSASRVAISGRIRNLTSSRTAVPRLAFDVRDATGTVLASWSETPPRRLLAANEIVPFTAAQVPPLPGQARDVVVHFTDGGRDHPLVRVSSQ